jgi:hypothetical protein
MRRGIPFDADQLSPGTRLFLETEVHFLDRHRLLEPDERRKLQPADFEPVEITIEGEDES